MGNYMERDQYLKLPHPCACCGRYEITFDYDICPVCGWESDIVQNNEPDYAGGANDLSLNDYRKKWLESQKGDKS